MENTIAFGARLAAWREAKGLTQQALADAAGMHRVAIADIERGRRGKKPQYKTVQTLAGALGITERELMEGLPGKPRADPKTEKKATKRGTKDKREG